MVDCNGNDRSELVCHVTFDLEDVYSGKMCATVLLLIWVMQIVRV